MALDPLARVMARMAQIERLLRTRMLERSSITDGIMTFIRGRLRLLGGAVLEIVGTVIGSGRFDWTGEVLLKGPWRFSGNGAITGDVVAEGKWTQNGAWEFNGPGDIAGTVDITGAMNIEGDTTISGDLDVDGPWTMSGDGDITGDVEVTGDMLVNGGGTIVVGTGTSAVRLDSSWNDPRINLGTVQVSGSPTGSSMTFTMGTDVVYFVNGTLRVPNVPDLPDGVAARYLVIGADGKFYKTTGVGGGGDGSPGPIAGSYMWPFSPSTTDPALGHYGMRLNPVTGVWALHQGQDFTVAYGSSIPAAGDAVVQASGYDAARGNYIILDHGGGITTHYFHMAGLSPWQVGDEVKRGDRIGAVGTTGRSTGPHLHWETHVGGNAIDPRQFMASQG